MTESEIEALRRSARKYSDLRFAYGGLSVLLGVLGLLGIIIASGGARWGWTVFVVLVIASLMALAYASRLEAVSLLHRRTVRVGQVDIFEKTEATAEVRAKYLTWSDPDGDPVTCVFWKEEEKLLEWMVKTAGGPVTTFETPIDDDVPIFVEGIAVQKAMDVHSVSLS